MNLSEELIQQKLKDFNFYSKLIDTNMVNQQLIDYIKQQLQQNVNKEQIKSSLINNGWEVSDVEEGFNSIVVEAQNNPIIPVQKTSNLFGKIIAGLSVVVVLTILGWFAYRYFYNSKINNQTEVPVVNQGVDQASQIPTTPNSDLGNQETPQADNQKSPVQTPAVFNDTDNWKSFSGNYFTKYEFKYPANIFGMASSSVSSKSGYSAPGVKLIAIDVFNKLGTKNCIYAGARDVCNSVVGGGETACSHYEGGQLSPCDAFMEPGITFSTLNSKDVDGFFSGITVSSKESINIAAENATLYHSMLGNDKADFYHIPLKSKSGDDLIIEVRYRKGFPAAETVKLILLTIKQ